MQRRKLAQLAAALLSWPLAITPALAETSSESSLADAWAFRAMVYGWFPDARASANAGLPGAGSVRVDTDPGNYLSKLEFAFMGTLEARKGRWSFVGDAVYVDFGHQQSNVTALNGMSLPVPVDVHLDLSAFVSTLEAGYALSQAPAASVDLVGGARYLHLRTTLDMQLSAAPPGVPTQVGKTATKDYWDGVIGLRGRSELPNDWFVPYYVDVGTGSSSLTWQAFAGVGHRFKWGDVMAGYRYLAYEFKDGEPLSDLRLGGPIVGIGLRF